MKKLLVGACFFLSLTTAQAAPNVAAKPPTLDPTYGLAKPKLAPPKAGAPVASWIWAAQSGGKQAVFARRVFALNTAPKSATIYATGDDAASVWVNGHQVVKTSSLEQDWKTAQSAAVEKFLRAGKKRHRGAGH